MSGRYPVVSWRELVKLVQSHGYTLKSQRGSHMKFVLKGRSMVVIPRHRVISIGVLKTALREVSRVTGIPEEELLKEL